MGIFVTDQCIFELPGMNSPGLRCHEHLGVFAILSIRSIGSLLWSSHSNGRIETEELDDARGLGV